MSICSPSYISYIPFRADLAGQLVRDHVGLLPVAGGPGSEEDEMGCLAQMQPRWRYHM